MRHLTASLVVALFAVHLGGCDLFPDQTITFSVTLSNESLAPIHIVAEGEAFDMSNRLEPGQTRVTVFPTSRSDFDSSFRVEGNFRAGFNAARALYEKDWAEEIKIDEQRKDQNK